MRLFFGFAFFNFDIHLMVLAVIALVVALACRRAPWVSALWLPITTTAAQKTAWVILVMMGNFKNEWLVPIAWFFVLPAGSPWLVILLISCFNRPRTWASRPVWIGIAVFVFIAGGNYLLTTDGFSLQAIAPDGKPVADMVFASRAERYGARRPNGIFRTNGSGRFHFRGDPRGHVRFELSKPPGFHSCSIDVEGTKAHFDHYPPNGFYRIHVSWHAHDRNDPRPSSSQYLIARGATVPCFLEPINTPESPAFREFLRTRTIAAKEGREIDPDSFQYLFQNPESFYLIDEIAGIISDGPIQNDRPVLRGPAIAGLAKMSAWLAEIGKLEREIEYYRSSQGRPNEAFAYYRRWAGVDPSVPYTAARNLINERCGKLADQLIAASRPYWSDACSSIDVVRALDRFGYRALPQFQDALSGATARERKMIIEALPRIAERVEDVQWAVSSKDPELVVAAYDGIRFRGYLTQQEHSLAVERLSQIEKTVSDPRLQERARYVAHGLRIGRSRDG